MSMKLAMVCLLVSLPGVAQPIIELLPDGGATCRAASESSGGCFTTGTQYIKGAKGFLDGLTSDGPLYATYLTAYSGGSVRIYGDRSTGDTAADVILGSAYRRTLGDLVAIMNGDDKVLVITPFGDIIPKGALIVGNGISGQAGIEAAQGRYLVLKGREDEAETAYSLEDGGVLPYGGLHGSVTVVPGIEKKGGFIFQTKNAYPSDGGVRNDWFYVDHMQGFGQRNGFNFSQFGGPSPTVMSTLGQFHFGQLESTFMYAFNRTGVGATHWHVKNIDGEASDGGWRMLPYADEVVSRAEYNALLARLTDAGL